MSKLQAKAGTLYEHSLLQHSVYKIHKKVKKIQSKILA